MEIADQDYNGKLDLEEFKTAVGKALKLQRRAAKLKAKAKEDAEAETEAVADTEAEAETEENNENPPDEEALAE